MSNLDYAMRSKRGMDTMAIRLLIVAATITGILFTGIGSFGENHPFTDLHGTSFQYFFDCDDMDFHFGNLILGAAVNQGIQTGEAFWAASNIIDGDSSSWQDRWNELAQKVETRGNESFANGRMVSARDQFLRAAYYYRISLISMLPDNPFLRPRANQCRELMKKAGKLMDPPLEYIEIPFEGSVLQGYFRKANQDNTPTKTLLMIGGGETFAEDLYYYLAPQTFARGYNFLTVDLPGQGIMPLDGKVFRADMYVPMKSVVDYALTRVDVDPGKLYAYGISGGGVFVPQTAMHDNRIMAIAMSSGVVDAYDLFSTMPVTKATQEEMLTWTSFHRDVVRSINWRWGVELDNPAGLVEANRGFAFDPDKITIPTLLIVGEGEYKSEEVQRQQKVIMDNVQNDNKKMVITPSNEGATNHCVMENRGLVGQVLFDWLDAIVTDNLSGIDSWPNN